MIKQSKKTNFCFYTARVLAVSFLVFTPPIFADLLNNNKEGFFRVLSTEIPKTRDIVYISETYSDAPFAKGRPIVTVKAMKKDGSGSV